MLYGELKLMLVPLTPSLVLALLMKSLRAAVSPAVRPIMVVMIGPSIGIVIPVVVIVSQRPAAAATTVTVVAEVAMVGRMGVA